MNEFVQGEFLRKRMIELREKSGKSLSDMAVLLNCNKSTLSRVENGSSGYKTIFTYAKDYCRVLNLTELQTEQFLRGVRVVVTDTSALLKNTQLIDELSKEYSYVIVPSIVVDELDNIKDHNTNGLAARAWQILRSIRPDSNVISRPYTGDATEVNNDVRIIEIARAASDEFNCCVDIITYDTGFAARLSDDDVVKSLFLEDYLITKQNLVDMNSIKKFEDYYADSYQDIESELGIRHLGPEDVNAYLPNGYTLIIAAVRSKAPLSQRKEKIRCLIELGADVNKRDCGNHYLPPLSHAVQKGDFEIFKFLLHECHANPNVGSRNPHDSNKFFEKKTKKNDGNMPLMIAAWDNKLDFVRELLADERTSINQQDANGFTALIKACYWGWLECRDLLIEAGADQKIVDRNGYTAADRYNEFLETGRRKNGDYKKKNQKGQKNYSRGYRR